MKEFKWKHQERGIGEYFTIQGHRFGVSKSLSGDTWHYYAFGVGSRYIYDSREAAKQALQKEMERMAKALAFYFEE